MRAVVQRVHRAQVSVEGERVGAIERPGLVAFVGVTHDDDAAKARALAGKIANLRVLEGEKSLLDEAAPVLLISQFTLYGDTRKGRRPSWIAAAPGAAAEPLVERVVDELRELGLDVATGRFGAMMDIDIHAAGPVTLLLEV